MSQVIFIHNRMVHSSGHNLGTSVRIATIQDFQRVRPKSRIKWGTPDRPSGFPVWWPSSEEPDLLRLAPDEPAVYSVQWHHGASPPRLNRDQSTRVSERCCAQTAWS